MGDLVDSTIDDSVSVVVRCRSLVRDWETPCSAVREGSSGVEPVEAS